MPGDIESLNVSVATGIALFEAVRQRLASRRSRPLLSSGVRAARNVCPHALGSATGM
jgi:hypothetical protein